MENIWCDSGRQLSSASWTTIERKNDLFPLGNFPSTHKCIFPNTTSNRMSGSTLGYVEQRFGPAFYKQALASLQHYPTAFVRAWLLLAQSLEMSTERAGMHCRPDSVLSVEVVAAITMLKDLPHEQVLEDLTRSQDAKAVDRSNHSDSNSFRSSITSSNWSKCSSTRPSSTSSVALLDASLESHEGEKRTSKRFRHSAMDDLPEENETSTSREVEQPSPCIYKCTGCSKAFKSMHTWSRHEKEDHEDISFPCMPNGAIEFTKNGRECALCGQEPTEEHLKSHNIEECTQLKHVFKRYYELNKHLETHGIARDSKLSKMLVTMWQRQPDKQAWACGFCRKLFSSLTEFHKHVAVQHYENGETRTWCHTKVILGLLSQPHVEGSWQTLLATRFKVGPLSCKWKKSTTRDLQSRLELGQEPGDVLAQAALDCANYNHNLLLEGFRCTASAILDSDVHKAVTVAGPPVPPKPLSISAAYDQSNPRSMSVKVALRPSPPDQFKTPSPPLFDTSLYGSNTQMEQPPLINQDLFNDPEENGYGNFLDSIDLDMMGNSMSLHNWDIDR